jgi:hypothetical protein
MPSQDYPNSGYYMSLLSQYDTDKFGQEDHVEVENEVMEVSRMHGKNSKSKMKGRSKNSVKKKTIYSFLDSSMLDKIQLMETSKKCNFLGTSREVLS